MSPSEIPANPRTRTRLKIAGVLFLVLLGVAAAVALSWRAVGNAVGDFESSPVRAAAMRTVRESKEVDLVSTDDAAGRMTVRNRKTGAEVMVSFEEAAKGEFPDTQTSNSAPVGVAGQSEDATPPTWVPTYPGARQHGAGMKVEKLDSIAGAYTARSPDSPAKVKAFFEETLKGGGFELESTVTDGKGSAMVSGKAGGNRTLLVLINADEADTSLVVNYEGPKQ